MGSRLENNSKHVSKRIQSHAFEDETGEEYKASTFGGFTDYMRRKKIKLQNLDAELRSQSADKPKIFRGVVVYVNGYTQPPLSDLHTLIVAHGGGFLQYLDGKTACTHIIASQLTPKKKVEFAKYRIVKPAWVVDSVNAGKLQPWDNYRLVDEGVTQKVLGFENGNIVSQANKQHQSYRAHSETSWYTSQMKSKLHELNGDSDISHTQNEQNKVENNSGDSQNLSEYLGDGDEYDQLADQFEDEDASLITPALEPLPMDEPNEKPHSEEHVESYVTNEVSLQTGDQAGTAAAVIQTGNQKRLEENRQLTAEEHNAALLQNPHMAKSSTANPDFLNQYYRESRLHHLSSWKADLKAQLQARTAERSASQRPKQKKLSGLRRYILHIDFDSFFAAVSLRKSPHLTSKPVVIAHGSGPGSEIASCNYPAREFGVKNGMWMKTALQLCPDLKVLPYDFKAYEEASRHFYDSILNIEGTVQSISIDEALLDVSEQCIRAGGTDGRRMIEGAIDREQAKANELAQSLRTSVKSKTECEVSVGIGGNILLAKVALRRAKPAGQYLIKPEEILDFIGELNVIDLPGVAHSLSKKLEEVGVKLVRDIRALTKERLMTALGPKTGEKLWDYSRGIDRVEVGDQVVRKSVSAEVNWGIRFVTQQQAEDFVQCLCDELHRRLLENAVKGRQLTMKIMRKSADAGMDPPKNLGHGKCDTFNKSVVLGVSTNDKAVLGKEAISILRSYGFSPGELRGLGVQMQRLEPIKPVSHVGSSAHDSSQRRLQFKKPDATNTPQRPSPKLQSTTMPTPGSTSKPSGTIDSIEEVPTPEKRKHMSPVQGAIDSSTSEHDKPLNIIGTQFMLPSQIDPDVLAELPADIRSKFAPKQKSILDKVARYEPDRDNHSRSASPYLSDNEYGLPNQSQLDPEALAALPDDMRYELMQHYRSNSNVPSSRENQQLLPQSPRKVRPTIPSKNVQLTPTKKNKHSSLIGMGRSETNELTFPTLTQSNFVSMAKGQAESATAIDEEISKSFLDELPEDVRIEILAEQKRNRMKSKSGLNLGNSKRRPRVDASKAESLKGQQKLQLIGPDKKPTFTSRKLSSLPDLRDAMSAWVQEFSEPGEEGPFEEDAAALGQYLQKVVLYEKDMAKAVAVIDWLAYLVSDWPFEQMSVRDAWLKIIHLLREEIQDSVAQRGLPPVVFDRS